MTFVSFRKATTFVPYIALVTLLAVFSFSAHLFLSWNPHISEELDFQVFVFGGLLFAGYLINRIAPKTVIPSFVWAMLAGIALQPLLSFYTRDVSGLLVIMEILGAIILFAGGLEIPFKSFKKWFFQIASLSLIGVIISSVVFSFALLYFAQFFIPFDASLIPSVVILSAALASTDESAILPLLKTLHLKRGFLKNIIISEGSLSDVSGSVITKFLLLGVFSTSIASQQNGIFGYFVPLFRKATYDALALQIVSGVVIGYIGFALIKKFYYQHNAKGGKEGLGESDPALLIAVPIFTYALGNILGGAGFLASFVSGLLSDVEGGIKKALHFFESLLGHLINPFIFIMLGALVPLPTLIKLAPLGIIAGLLFMFVIRPLVVFISLLPWLSRSVFTVRDLLFLSFIRETGIIPAILLIVASAHEIIASEFVIAIGMWVIFLTLILEPPLTAPLARAIGIADRRTVSRA